MSGGQRPRARRFPRRQSRRRRRRCVSASIDMAQPLKTTSRTRACLTCATQRPATTPPLAQQSQQAHCCATSGGGARYVTHATSANGAHGGSLCRLILKHRSRSCVSVCARASSLSLLPISQANFPTSHSPRLVGSPRELATAPTALLVSASFPAPYTQAGSQTVPAGSVVARVASLGAESKSWSLNMVTFLEGKIW